MLVVIATVRGAYVALEQPSSSCMKFFPDLVAVGAAISKCINPTLWQEQFLYRPRAKHIQMQHLQYDDLQCVCVCAILFIFFVQHMIML